MSASEFLAPQSVDQAVEILQKANGDAAVLAGGTDLLVQLKNGIRRPRIIVDIKRIPELSALELAESGLRLGAALASAKLNRNSEIKAAYPGLVEAADLIGSSQIQGRASVGGNLCNGSPAADTVPALAALNATCRIAGPSGFREVPVAEFTTGPGQTVLAPGEFLVDFQIDARPARSSDAYLRFIPRTEMDIAVVGAGVALTLDEAGNCTQASVALGAVAPTVISVPAAASALIGSSLDDAALAQAASAASDAAAPIDDKRGTVAFRKHVAGVLVKRAAKIAAGRAVERN